jgi:DNA-binding transcriptional LysR family regulator
MDLNRVVTFVRVVESGSFTAAARTLHVPTSSVSRGVAKLEAELDVVLLERTTRKIALTDAGRAYYERAREAVAGLDEASALAAEASREPQGIVHLAAPPEMSGHLAAIIGMFVRRYPRIHVDVMTTARGAELVGAEVDVAIVLGKLEDSSLIVRRLGSSTARLFASPDYIARRGMPRAVADLARHDAVLFRGTAGRATWELAGPRGVERVEVRGALSADHVQFVMDAVIAGHGIGLVPERCPSHHAQGDSPLVPVLPKYGALGGVQSLVHPTRHLPRRVALLRDFLTEHLEATCNKVAIRSNGKAA